MSQQWDKVFDRMDEWNQSVDRWIDRVHQISTAQHLQPTQCVIQCQPAIDVYETEEELVVLAELAGINPDDVVLHIQPGQLVIRGERRDLLPETVHRLHQLEIWSGAFAVEVSLPSHLDIEASKSSYRAGLLEVKFPKDDPGDRPSESIHISVWRRDLT